MSTRRYDILPVVCDDQKAAGPSPQRSAPGNLDRDMGGLTVGTDLKRTRAKKGGGVLTATTPRVQGVGSSLGETADTFSRFPDSINSQVGGLATLGDVWSNIVPT